MSYDMLYWTAGRMNRKSDVDEKQAGMFNGGTDFKVIGCTGDADYGIVFFKYGLQYYGYGMDRASWFESSGGGRRRGDVCVALARPVVSDKDGRPGQCRPVVRPRQEG